MKRIVQVAAIVACLVYPVYADAQPASMTTNTSASTAKAVPAMAVTRAPKAPEPAAMKVPVLSVSMNPVAPAPTPVAAMPAMAAPVASVAAPAATVPVQAAMTAPVENAPQATAPVVSAPKESGLDKADKWIGLIIKMLLGLLAIIGAIVTAIKGTEWRQSMKSGRWAKILEYARKYAFPAVESIAKSTSWAGDDKLAEFIKRLDDWLQGEGDKPLSADEQKLLKREAADMAASDKADDPAKEVDEKAVSRRRG